MAKVRTDWSGGEVEQALTLVPYLLQHPRIPVEEVTATFGIPKQRLFQLLNVLFMCGPSRTPGGMIEVDIEAAESQGVVIVTNADTLNRPIRLSVNDAIPIVLGVRALRELVGEDLQSAADSVLAKLTQALGGEQEGLERVRVELATGDPQVRQVLQEAVTAGQMVVITHRRHDTDRRLEVEPHAVLEIDGVGYLQAWSRLRGDWRVYRLDRISAAELTAEAVHDHGAAPDVRQDWQQRLAEAPMVELELSPQASWVVEYFPVQELAVPEEGDGRRRVRIPVVDPVWLRRLLLELGPRVQLLSTADLPTADLARGLAEEANAALDHYAAVAASRSGGPGPVRTDA